MREYFCTKLVFQFISLPGPHCLPPAPPIEPRDIEETEAYEWGEVAARLNAEDDDYTWFAGKQELKQALCTWEFLDRMILESHHVFAAPMARAIRRKVLEVTLKPLLTKQVQEDATLSFNAFLAKLITYSESGQLKQQLMRFILGKHESMGAAEEDDDDYDPFPGISLKKGKRSATSSSVMNTYDLLLDRCNHVSDEITTNTLRLFDSCFQSPDTFFIDNTL